MLVETGLHPFVEKHDCKITRNTHRGYLCLRRGRRTPPRSFNPLRRYRPRVFVFFAGGGSPVRPHRAHQEQVWQPAPKVFVVEAESSQDGGYRRAPKPRRDRLHNGKKQASSGQKQGTGDGFESPIPLGEDSPNKRAFDPSGTVPT